MHRKVMLTAFVVSPLVVLVLLVVMISRSLERGVVKVPPIGAGAGETGGANAIGEAFGRAREGAQPQVTPARNGQPQPEPRLVDPATLEQGFILVVQDETTLASSGSPIYLAGNVNNWNPADPDYRLSAQADMRWRITLTKPRSRANERDPIEFKFTRGSWDLEELDAQLQPISNRRLPMIDVSRLRPGEIPVIEVAIERWGDERPDFQDRKARDPYRAIRATGDLRRLQVQGGAGTALGMTRDLLVWLPPGYDAPENATRNYPVLYLHDGQNLFEKLPNVPGEWQADETATQLITSNAASPFIIVGIPHSGSGRRSEYMPVRALADVDPQGGRHVAWLLNEVMPRVERAFRVSTDPAQTVIGGASLGAVISLEAVRAAPQRFGGLYLESMPMTLGDRAAWTQWLGVPTPWPTKVFVGMGEKEYGEDADQDGSNAALAQAARDLAQRVTSEAGTGVKVRLDVTPGAQHTESAWAQRMPDALRFFFPPAMTDGAK